MICVILKRPDDSLTDSKWQGCSVFINRLVVLNVQNLRYSNKHLSIMEETAAAGEMAQPHGLQKITTTDPGCLLTSSVSIVVPIESM